MNIILFSLIILLSFLYFFNNHELEELRKRIEFLESFYGVDYEE